MQKRIFRIIILCLIFVVLELILLNNKNRHIITYNLNNFNIIEEYNKKIKNGYYIKITINDNIYSYQFDSRYLGKKIITDIKYYEDENLECILPIFNNEIIFDVTCLNKKENNNYVYLHNMNDVDDKLLEFIKEIDEYSVDKFIHESKTINLDKYNVYVDNIENNFSVETYRGLIINNKVINLFNNDVYSKLGTYTDNYYVVPTYKSEYEFNELYIVNLNSGKIKKLKLDYDISYSSYYEGIDGDIIYLFDIDNKTQYKIDCKKETFDRIGSLNNDINVYEDGIWDKKSVSEVIKNNYYFDFKNYRNKIDDNTFQDLVNNYIYTFVRIDNGYKVYKSNKYTPDIKNYLFDIYDINSVIYDGDKFYFKRDDYIGYYSETEGIKKIIQGNELLFNKSILFMVTL